MWLQNHAAIQGSHAKLSVQVSPVVHTLRNHIQSKPISAKLIQRNIRDIIQRGLSAQFT